MPTLYCDHNVLITVCDTEGFPPRGAFGRLLESGRVDFVFSTTHLIEASRMRTITDATNVARLLDLTGRYWLPDRVSLELDEIRHVVGGGPAPQPLLCTVTEVTGRLDRGQRRAPEVVTALRLVQGWHARPSLLGPMLASHQQNVRAFKANTRDVRAGKLKPERDVALARLVIQKLAAIHGVAIDAQPLNALNIESMPTFHTELLLSRLRWSRGGNFRWQSFMDGEHLIAGMPHVDVYFTFDQRKRRLARTLSRQCSSCRSEIVGSFEDAEIAAR